MQIQLGDRLTDATWEDEVIGRPYTTNARKDVHACVRRLDNADYSVLFPDLRGAALQASWMYRYGHHFFI